MVFKIIGLMVLTAICEIVGCYLPYLWIKHKASIWILLPAFISLMAFVGLLSLHPQASGRVYATYGGVYILSALAWLKWVDKLPLQLYDWIGAAIILVGVLVICFGWKIDAIS